MLFILNLKYLTYPEEKKIKRRGEEHEQGMINYITKGKSQSTKSELVAIAGHRQNVLLGRFLPTLGTKTRGFLRINTL